MDQMEPNEIAYVNESGVRSIIVKNSANTYERFTNSVTDLNALLAASTFTDMEELITTVATLRDNAIVP